MAKELLKILDSIDSSLGELGLSSEMFTVSTLIYTTAGGAVRSGQIKCSLDELMEAIVAVNRKLSKISKLEKRLKALESKKK